VAGSGKRVAGGELRVAGVLKIGKRKKPGDEGKSTIHFQVGDFFHLPHFTFHQAVDCHTNVTCEIEYPCLGISYGRKRRAKKWVYPLGVHPKGPKGFRPVWLA